MHFLRLVRWPNLVIVFLTQLLAWVCVIHPLQFQGNTLLLGFSNFLFVAFSTVLIAGAGYIINDYFDIRIDNINKPEKMVLEKAIPRRMAILMHSALNIVALLFAAVVALKGSHPEWITLQLCCTLLLWFYSTHLKQRFAIGNLAVAFLTALTIITLILYEPVLHSYMKRRAFVTGPNGILPNPVWVLLTYAYFAFMLTWMREIVKDMEDLKGDEAEGCITMPIRWGLAKSTRFTLLLGTTVLIPLSIAAWQLLMSRDWLLGSYCLLALILPVAVWIFFLPKAATTTHYAKASRYLKLIMVAGIGSLIIYYIEANA